MCIFLLLLPICQGCLETPKNGDISKDATICLQIQHALRIPHNIIVIHIEDVNGRYTLQADTKPMEGHPRSKQYPPFHKVKTLSNEKYEELLSLLNSLHWDKLKKKETNITGLDGSTWALTYRQNQIENTASIWSPDYETQKRNLQDFLKVCQSLLREADIEPQTSMPNN